MTTSDSVVLGDASLAPQAIASVAQGRLAQLSEPARARIAAARKIVLRCANDHSGAAYGLTTGVGSLKRQRIPEQDFARFNLQMVRDHAGGVGPVLSSRVVRALMAVRVHGMGRGGSGVAPFVADGLIALLNAGVVPRVRAYGSVGASDLSPLAEVGRVLIGEGTADVAGKTVPGRDALLQAGLQPLVLGPKDGLALLNANALTVALASLGLCDFLTIRTAQEIVIALSFEALRANLSVLDPALGAAYVLPGHGQAAGRLRDLLAGSALWHPAQAPDLQDPISFRAAPQLHGALETAVSHLSDALGVALDAAADNPLVVAAAGVEARLVSGGNFDATYLCLAIDGVKSGLARAVALAARRTGALLTTSLSGLPTGLGGRVGDYGLGILHHTAASLAQEAAFLANTTPYQGEAVAEGVEDYGAMASLAARNLIRLLEITRLAVAVEAHVAVAALRLRRAVGIAPLLSPWVQKLGQAVSADSSPGEAVEAVARVLIPSLHTTGCLLRTEECDLP